MTRRKSRARTPGGSIIWTERALDDLREIEEYIAGDDSRAAERWIARIIAQAEIAARMPLAGRVVPERARHDIREVFVRTYRIVYRVRADGIVILTVFEGHRRMPPDVGTDKE